MDDYDFEITMPDATSPRKLQEVTLAEGNGVADMTTSSGISMKQYEEQLNGLKKENFNLKLRVYFLEERLGSGAPPAVQGLLEHNVRLQVELEELKRQLTDKQQLLAAAAQAIDVLEHQGSSESDAGSLSGIEAGHKETKIPDELLTSKSVGLPSYREVEAINHIPLETTENEDLTDVDKDELNRLRHEHKQALGMICKCYKEIKHKDKQIKQLNQEKDMLSSQYSEYKKMEDYEDILKSKDQHIHNLESRLQDLEIDRNHNGTSRNLQEVLTKRLQNIALFLDKLLANKCVLGEDKKRLAESVLEQSLALGAGLKLDESFAPADLTAHTDDDSALEISQALRLQDLTMLLGHHKFDTADSECWSEPDRNVSSARIGLAALNPNATVSLKPVRHSLNLTKQRRARASSSDMEIERQEWLKEKEQLETCLKEEKDISARLQAERDSLTEELESITLKLQETNVELNEVSILLKTKEDCLIETKSDKIKLTLEVEERREEVRELRMSRDELEQRLVQMTEAYNAVNKTVEQLKAARIEFEAMVNDRERSLRRAADEATLAASTEALERTREHHQRLAAQRRADEALHALHVHQSQIQQTHSNLEVSPRPPSPDQGIDSDRLSSLDTDANDPRILQEENATLREKLSCCRAALSDALAQLNASNARKRNMQRAICRELHKTHGVLKQARDQFQAP